MPTLYSLSDVSVCMPYWNRQPQLDQAMRLYREHYDAIEISICADGCKICAPSAKISMLLYKTEALCPCTPINRAVDNSTRDVILLTNPEVAHDVPIIEKMLQSIEGPNDYVIAACVDRHTGHTLCRSTYIGDKWQPIPPGAGFHFCVMFTRDLWERAGGFDEDYRAGQGCDDNDWCWRAWKAGANFIYRDDCLVFSEKVTHVQWPVGGLKRNQALLKEKWSETWNNLSS